MGRPLEEARKRAEFTLRSFEAGSLQENDMVVALARDVLAQARVIDAASRLVDAIETEVFAAATDAITDGEALREIVVAKEGLVIALAAGGETETPPLTTIESSTSNPLGPWAGGVMSTTDQGEAP